MLNPTVRQVISQVSPQDKLAEAERLTQQVIQLYQQGKYNEAIPLAEQALAIHKQQLGDNHPSTASSLNNLAELYQSQGRYSEAEPLYKQALAIFKQQLGDNHPNTATSLSSLAALYRDIGRYSEAEPLYQQALAIWKKQLGDNHPLTAQSLNNLALLYESQGRYQEAESIYQDILFIVKKQLGDNHSSTATSLNNLALLYDSQGRYSEAEPLLKEALDIRKQQLGDNHPDTAQSLNNLAALYESQGRYSEAEPLYQQALAIRKQQLGDNHPDTATSLNSLATLYYSQYDIPQAINYRTQALAVEEYNLSENLKMGDDKQKQDYMAKVSGTTDEVISLNLQAAPNNPEATRLALKTILERKGRILDVLTNSLQILRQQINDPEIKELLEQYSQKQTELSNLTFQQEDKNKKEEYSALSASTIRKYYLDELLPANLVFDMQQLQQTSQRLADISNRVRSASDSIDRAFQFLNGIIKWKIEVIVLENDASQRRQRIQTTEKISSINTIHQDLIKIADQLSRRSAEFRNLSQPITLEGIQKLIPADAALVEIVRYRPVNPKAPENQRFGIPRYAVYILYPNGDIKAKDLGEAKPIDDKLIYFRNNLADVDKVTGIPQTPIPQLKESARQLDETLMQPIRQLLGNTKTILLSPDAALNLIPFEALVDENNQYLVENYHITYLTSGRDLLRLKDKFASQQSPLIVADPFYGKAGEKVALTRSIDLSEFTFPGLPGTEEEAKAIKNILPQATVLTGSQATENAVKQVKKPNILHIATHGFFKPESNLSERNPGERNSPLQGERNVIENPLLRSGLVLAGVTIGQSAGDDGVLTALETTNLNLVGTKLVVLSACDTGKGDIKIGQGVYGLRRALVIAGSESQLISLWKVSDDATKDLMVAYYGRLQKGEGRSEALRQIQLGMLKGEKQKHPFYWASFIPSGDATSMTFD
ncbi:CHAT domain-containing tetratricopeptide repeat protein [Microcystis aeruginosa]|uniref:CHAT domain-containing tetratricopeptide repeat protein n=1 Tax=Microcystis aeruginosa TaxID=1126 RepID=UPI00086BB283|nr:kinesin light chain-like protein [Microcystis aeruginosa NIES-98]